MRTLALTIAVILFLAGPPGCVPQPGPLDDPMAEHFSRAKMVHTAVVYGDLELARDAARGLATAPPVEGLPRESERFALEMREAAATLGGSEGFAGATLAAGWLARTCGECHLANRVRLTRAATARPEGGGRLAAHMQRYRWAVDRMWEGVIGPSDAAWLEALPVLQSEPPDVTRLVDEGVGYAAALAQRIPELASGGASFDEVSLRAALFGEVLAACSDCHEQARGW